MVYDKKSIISPSMFSNLNSDNESNAIISEIATQIQNLTPEQLAVVIIESANSGLSNNHLNYVITVSNQILEDRQSDK